MEKKSAKEVKMDAKIEQTKLSYEQLEQIAGNLNQQCNILKQQLQEARVVIAEFNEIGLLLSIIDKGSNFDYNFIERCSKKVQDIITRMLDDSEKEVKEEE